MCSKEPDTPWGAKPGPRGAFETLRGPLHMSQPLRCMAQQQHAPTLYVPISTWARTKKKYSRDTRNEPQSPSRGVTSSFDPSRGEYMSLACVPASTVLRRQQGSQHLGFAGCPQTSLKAPWEARARARSHPTVTAVMRTAGCPVLLQLDGVHDSCRFCTVLLQPIWS
jgi:hypothetical protein